MFRWLVFIVGVAAVVSTAPVAVPLSDKAQPDSLHIVKGHIITFTDDLVSGETGRQLARRMKALQSASAKVLEDNADLRGIAPADLTGKLQNLFGREAPTESAVTTARNALAEQQRTAIFHSIAVTGETACQGADCPANIAQSPPEPVEAVTSVE